MIEELKNAILSADINYHRIDDRSIYKSERDHVWKIIDKISAMNREETSSLKECLEKTEEMKNAPERVKELIKYFKI